MATYAELLTAAGNDPLNQKMKVAVVIAAEKIRTELTSVTNHTNRMLWAKQAYADPAREALRMMWAVLAQNKAATYAQIIGADDATVQTAVDAAVDVFATGA